MSIKNAILIVLAISSGALFLILQKHSKDYDSPFDQSISPFIDEPTAHYRAPDFTLIDLDSNEYKLSSTRGDVVLLTFWTTY